MEELYDYVRHLHQSESREVTFDVQHKALIPVLRPYQSQAVNWMLWREKSRNTSPRGTLSFFCPVVEKTDVTAATATQLRLSMFCRTNAAFPLAGVDHFVREEVVLQPFYRLVRT